MEETNVASGITVPQFNERRVETWKSNKIDKLAAALAKAQAVMTGAKMSATNPFFKSNYASLTDVLQGCLPELNENGLSIIQGNDTCDKASFYVTTMLLHESGQWIRSKLKMPITKADAQGVGATITYARRFALSAMVGLGQVDDDGNSISTKVINKGAKNV